MMRNTSSPVTITDYRNALGHSIAAFCLGKGYTLASRDGLALDYSRLTYLSLNDSVGLLYDNPAQGSMPRRFFGLIKPKKLRRVFLGIIWFNEAKRGANDKYWVIDVYGRGNIKRAHELAKELLSSFPSIGIRIDLLQDQYETETYAKDYDDSL